MDTHGTQLPVKIERTKFMKCLKWNFKLSFVSIFQLPSFYGHPSLLQPEIERESQILHQ